MPYLTLGLLISIIVIGTLGYTLLGFTPSEAVYQTIITIATVGFEEVHQLDNRGMWFTILLVVVSIGIFFYAVTSFTRYIVEGVFMNSYKDNKVKRKIEKISGHVVICGYGRNGKQAAIELSQHNVKVVVIEQKPEIVQLLRDTPGMLYVEGDAADEEVLKLAHLESARAMITTLPEDADNLFVVLTARELSTDIKLISRASVDNSDRKLKRAGAGKSISELDLMNTSGANVVGLKREDNSYLINPVPETILTSSDKLFTLGTRTQIDQLIKTITSDGTGT